MRRRNLVVLVVASVVVSSGATWLGAVSIHSPAEVAARTAPPEPSPILVPVVEQVLATRVVTRGTAHHANAGEVWVVRSALKTGARVVTALPRPGATVASGAAMLEISGRPVFAFAGAVPVYRDLGPGVTGRDVQQLEEGLVAAGLDPGPVDGVYDDATGAAVALLYERHGAEPLIVSEAQVQRLLPLEAAFIPGLGAGSGVQVPADELVFVPEVPARVASLEVRLGVPPEGVLLTVTGSQVVVEGAVPVAQSRLIRVGADVEIDEPALALQASGRVARVADRPGTGAADAFHVAFEVVVDDPPATLVGSSVRVVIPLSSTREAGLTVPVSAVSIGPDGSSRVQRSVDGGLEVVPIRTGLSADGYVSVTPTSGTLAPGDLVLVGFTSSELPTDG